MGLRIRVPKSQSEPAADQGHHGGVGVGGAAAEVGTKDYICGTSLGAGSSCGDGNDADADADAAPFSQTSLRTLVANEISTLPPALTTILKMGGGGSGDYGAGDGEADVPGDGRCNHDQSRQGTDDAIPGLRLVRVVTCD